MAQVLCKAALITGSAIGWVGAVALALLPEALPEDRSIPAMLLLLSMALITSACLVTSRYQRPLGDAYELGYNRGRREAMTEANRSATTSTLRKVSN